MHPMTTNPQDPEYTRAYQHYIQHGQSPEQAARLAWEHAQRQAPARQSFARRNPGLLAALITAVVGVPVMVAIIALGQPPQDTASVTSTPTTTVAPTTAAPEPVVTTPPPPPVTYSKLTARQWQLIAKDPDAYTGKGYIVYGVVTQFDAATGNEGFRADVDGVRRWNDYEYPINTVLSGDPAVLKNVVQGDMFTAKVAVEGSYTYDTQIGGSTTVPRLTVVSITIL